MSASKRGLGRGLDALLPDSEAVTELPVNEISALPSQPRTRFPEKELTELAYSIRLHGILQPLVVTPSEDGYRLVAGERRLRAAKLAGLAHVPVHVRQASDQEHYELALLENIQRADLSPLEEATAYAKLIDDFELTQEELAKRLGRSRSAIAGSLRLLNLPPAHKRALEDGVITAGHASALLKFGGSDQTALFAAIVGKKLSVRQAEAWKPQHTIISKKPTIQPGWVRELSQQLGCQVERQGTDEAGKVVLKYHSREELEALVSRLGKA
jgi:ParB family chromosome partitioning protein